jgi:competence protein ComEC
VDRFALVGGGVVLGVTLAPWWLPSPGVAFPAGLALVAALIALGRRAWLEVLVGAALGASIVGTLPEGPRLRGPVAVVGTVVGAPIGRSVDVQVERWAPLGGTWRATRGRVRIVAPEPVALAPGAGLVAFGLGRPVEQSAPPGVPDAVAGARRARLRTTLVATVLRPLGPTPPPGDGRVPPLVRAFATGDRRGCEPADLDLMRRTGTSHLLAVSGSHVALVAAIATGLLRVPFGLLALRRPRGVSPLVGALGAVVVAFAFTLGVGAPVSAQRAAVAATLVLAGRAVGRRVDGLSILGLAATAVLVLDPAAVGSASFHLSFGAVLGLLTWGPALSARVPDRPRALGVVGKGLAVSVAATIGTLPACAWWFQQLPPLGPVANLLAVPWTGVVVAPASLLAVYGPDALVPWAAAVGEVAARALLAWLRLVDVGVLHPAVGPVGAAALCGLYGLARRPVLAAGLAFGVLLAPVPGPAEPTVTFPDVGQGSAALVAWPDGRRWLVDGGTRSAGVAAWLRRRGVRRLDVVVASHGDADHAGGLVEVLDTLTVGELRVAGSDGLDALLAAARARGVPVVDDPGRRLHPRGGTWARNDGSTVLALDVGGRRVVLPGDVSDDVERRLLDVVGRADVLALAHHGSATSTDPAWLSATAPDLAVVQCGRHNLYGHPDPIVRRRLADRGIPLLRTDLLGTVEITLGPTPRVRAHRQGVGWTEVRPRPPATVAPAAARPPPRPRGRRARCPATSTARGRSGSSGRRRRGRSRGRSGAPRTARGRSAAAARRSGDGAPARRGRRRWRTARPPRTAARGAASARAARPPAGRCRRRPRARWSRARSSSRRRSSRSGRTRGRAGTAGRRRRSSARAADRGAA